MIRIRPGIVPILALASLLMMCVGLVSWIYLHRHWPEIGRTVQEA